MTDRFLTTGQASELLGERWNERTIRRWCDRGLIEDAARAPGGWWKIPRESLWRTVDRFTPRRRRVDKSDT